MKEYNTWTFNGNIYELFKQEYILIIFFKRKEFL